MKKKLRVILISVIILIAFTVVAFGVIRIYFDKKTKEAYIEKVLELTGSDNANSVFLSMYPIDTMEDTAMRIGRLDIVAKVSDLAPDTNALVDALENAISIRPNMRTAYIGLNMEKTKEGFPWLPIPSGEDINTEAFQKLVDLAQRYPETEFEVVFAYPSMEYLLSERDEETPRFLQWYQQAAEFFVQYTGVSNLHIFLPGSEEWLICNTSNYLDAYNLNEEVATLLCWKVLCDHNYQLTTDNVNSCVENLKKLVERYEYEQLQKQSEYTYVFFGDSVIGNYVDTTSIPGVVAYLTSAQSINCGYGGLSATREGDNGAISGVVDAFLEGKYEYIPEGIIARDGIIKFNDIKENINQKKLVFFFSIGLNDYMSGKELFGKSKGDIYSYTGAIEYVVQQLRTAYPSCEVVLMTPNFISYFDNGTELHNGHTLIDYVEAIEQLSYDLNVKCIDIYRESGINEETEGILTADGCHPNEAGRYKIGTVISKYLAEWFPVE